MTEPAESGDEEPPSGWQTIERWELNYLALTVVSALLIWAIFALAHGRPPWSLWSVH